SPNGSIPSLVDAATRAAGIDPAVLRVAQGVWPDPLTPAPSQWASAGATAGQVRTAVDELARALLRDLAGGAFSLTCVDGVIRLRVVVAPDAAAVLDLSRTLRFACATLAPDLARTTDETRHL